MSRGKYRKARFSFPIKKEIRKVDKDGKRIL